MEKVLSELLEEEKQLQFERFNEDNAWELGAWLVAHARKNSMPVTIDIRCGDHQLFHASLPGTSVDNDRWIERKVRLVRRFGHSSYYIGRLLLSKGKTIEEEFLLPEREYAPHGGCFPIILKNTGGIGTIAVSGLPQEEDHRLVVLALRNYLNLV